MKSSKIIDLLKTFSKAEWRDCTNFLAWKYKERGFEWKMFKYLKNYKGDWENDALEISIINKKIAPSLARKRFLEKRSYLKSKIDIFLVSNVEETDAYKIDKYLLLGKIYKARGLYHLYKDLQKPIEKSARKLIVNDLSTNFRLLKWNHQRYFSEMIDLDNKISFLEKSMDHLEQFYQNISLLYETEAKNLEQLYNREIQKPSAVGNKTNKILQSLNKLLINRDAKNFEFLHTDLTSNLATYSKELQQIILLSLINYCNYQIRVKNFIYRQKILDLYEFGLETGISLNNGKLSERRFLNMVDVRSKVANTTESRDFIDKWLGLTNTNHEKTFRNLAIAIWCFAKESYRDAYDATKLLEITLKDINISHRVRLIKLCSLYSVDNKYPFFKQDIKNARDFYLYVEKKKKLNTAVITGARNLISILEMLWNRVNYEQLLDFKSNCKHIVHESWIEKTLSKMAQKK